MSLSDLEDKFKEHIKTEEAATVDHGQALLEMLLDEGEEFEKKLDKLWEPPFVNFVKPLPKPVVAPRKKRDDPWVGTMKERYAKFRKYETIRNFADIEDDLYLDDFGSTIGTAGKLGAGRIRLSQVDEKTNVRFSETLQNNLQRRHVWSGRTTVKKKISGTASRVVFARWQGLEFVTPQAAEIKVKEANAKLLSNKSGFLKLNKK